MENSQVPSRLHFWFFGNCLGQERASPPEFFWEKDLRVPTGGVCVDTDPVVPLIALNSQPKAY